MSTPSSFGSKPKPKLTTKRKVVLGLAGGAVGIVGILWYRSHQASSAANTADTSATDPNAIDPNTGVPYADETGFMGGIGTTPGALGTYDPATGTYIPGSGTVTPPSQPGTNAEWAASAIGALTGEGFDPVATTTAIGAYLAGAALTADQYSIVQAALGLEGQPPGGAPPPHQTGGGGGTGSGGSITVPNVIGQRAATAFAAITAKGLQARLSQPTPSGLTGTVTAQSPNGGTKVSAGSIVQLTNTVTGSSTGGGGSGVTVPNVTGQRAATGVAKMASVGLVARLSRGTPAGWTGKITSQSPSAGSKVKRGSSVQLTNSVTAPKSVLGTIQHVP